MLNIVIMSLEIGPCSRETLALAYTCLIVQGQTYSRNTTKIDVIFLIDLSEFLSELQLRQRPPPKLNIESSPARSCDSGGHDYCIDFAINSWDDKETPATGPKKRATKTYFY